MREVRFCEEVHFIFYKAVSVAYGFCADAPGCCIGAPFGGVSLAADVAPGQAVENAALHYQAIKKRFHSLENRRDRIYVSFCCGNVVSKYVGVVVFGFGVFFGSFAAVVENVAVDEVGRHVVAENHFFGDIAEIPVGIPFVEQPHLYVGIPSAVFHRQSAIEVESGHRVSPVGESLLLEFQQGLAQCWRKYLVGIKRQHVGVCRERRGVLSLRSVAAKRSLRYFAPVFYAQLHGAVGGAGVHHHYFIGNAAQRFEARFDAVLFVECQYCSR